LWQSEHSLTQFTDKKEFKSYADLTGRLAKALGQSAPMARATEMEDEEVEEVAAYRPKAAPAKQEKEAWNEDDEVFTKSDAEDDLPNFFKKLAEE